MLDRAAALRAPFAAACALLIAGGPAWAASRQPVVVELYTSQGCSACTSADDLTASLDGRKGVLALTFPVDYWDYLGWRDTFAQPAFSDRQRAYAKALGEREVFTPQVVVNGLAQTGKAEPGQSLTESTQALIQKAAKARARGPTIRLLHRSKVAVGASRAPVGGADVWLVRYEAAPPETAVTAGENQGRAVRYHNVVRELDRLGSWSGRAHVYIEPQASAGNLKSAVLVQAKDGGRILAVLAQTTN
jgi:hypothetical protein